MSTKRFTSAYTVTLDAKSRVCVPALYRQLLAARDTEGVYVCPSTAGAMLECFGEDVLEREGAKLESLDPFSKEYNRVAAKVVMRAQMLPFDENGRIRLPDVFISRTALAGKAMIVGAFDKFLIMSPEAYEAMLAEADKDVAELTEGGAE